MPYELSIPITTENPQPPTMNMQRGMHAALMKGFQTASEPLSAQIHAAKIKPFTQALLYDRNATKLLWRITLLDDMLYDPLCTGLLAAQINHAGSQTISVEVSALQTKHHIYTDLQGSKPFSRLQLNLLTPTTFKQRHYNEPLPSPYLCFQSWWKRWNNFAPAEFAINTTVLDIVTAHMVVSYFKLHSQVLKDKKRTIIGGVGKMTFAILQQNKVAEQWWLHVSTLANFAPYCGTGSKTTQGMGQTSSLPI